MQDYITASSGGPTGRQCPAAQENFIYWRSTAVGIDGYRLQTLPNGNKFYHVPVLEINAEGIGDLASQLASVAPWGVFGVYLAEFFFTADWTALAGA
jgi:hypothetical protein